MVIGATGHQNIPSSAFEYVRRQIQEALDQARRPLEGASALAVGADQLFAERVLGGEGRLHVVVPSRGYEATFKGSDRDRYERLLTLAYQVETLNYPEPSEEAFLAAGKRIVDMCDLLLAVWDGREAQGPGGTADVVAYAREVGKPVEIIWPEGMVR